MDFRLRRQSLLERATRVEEEARRAENAQARDLMRALAALYREMAEELGERGLFERRFLPVDFALFSLAIEAGIERSSAESGARCSCAGRRVSRA